MRNLRLSMPTIKAALLGFAFCVLVPLASCQGFLNLKTPEVNVFAGYSLVRYDSVPLGFADKLNMNGGILELSLPNLYQGFGVVADISEHRNDEIR